MRAEQLVVEALLLLIPQGPEPEQEADVADHVLDQLARERLPEAEGLAGLVEHLDLHHALADGLAGLAELVDVVQAEAERAREDQRVAEQDHAEGGARGGVRDIPARVGGRSDPRAGNDHNDDAGQRREAADEAVNDDRQQARADARVRRHRRGRGRVAVALRLRHVAAEGLIRRRLLAVAAGVIWRARVILAARRAGPRHRRLTLLTRLRAVIILSSTSWTKRHTKSP